MAIPYPSLPVMSYRSDDVIYSLEPVPQASEYVIRIVPRPPSVFQTSSLSQPRSGVAFFDFDGTLVEGDSLLPFLGLVVGRRRARSAFVRAVQKAVRLYALRRPPDPDLRTAIKIILLRKTLAGVPVEQAMAAAERLVSWVRWKHPQRAALERHRAEGRRIVIATGALDLYAPVLLRDLPVDDIIATELEAVEGVLTGRMARGNCVRAVKAERVARYMAEHGPFDETWGYGNRPSDLPMLALLDHRVIV